MPPFAKAGAPAPSTVAWYSRDERREQGCQVGGARALQLALLCSSDPDSSTSPTRLRSQLTAMSCPLAYLGTWEYGLESEKCGQGPQISDMEWSPVAGPTPGSVVKPSKNFFLKSFFFTR